MFIVGAVVTVLYLVADAPRAAVGRRRQSGPAGIMARLPGAATLDRLAYRTVAVRLPGLDLRGHRRRDLGRPRLGPVLGLGPQGDLGVHHLGGLRRRTCTPGPPPAGGARRAAYIQLLGFGCLMFNFFGINLWITGLHSYAGID